MRPALSRTIRLTIGLALGTALAGCARDTTPVAPLAPRTPSAPRRTTGPLVTVTSTADAGPGSLRDAIASAPDGSTITFDASLAGQTVALTTPSFVIGGKSVTIVGDAARGVTVASAAQQRLLVVLPDATVTLRNVTLVGSDVSPGGGGVIDNQGRLTIDHATITGGTGDFAGGIYNFGTLTLVDATISGNAATTRGGGLLVAAGTATLTHVTVAGNQLFTATGGGSGISVSGGALLDITNSIVGQNGFAFLGECVVETGGLIAQHGVNISSSASNCGLTLASPNLGPLADNGGPTPTMLPVYPSPAIDAAPSCAAGDDQRHVARPLGARCDVGAVEFDRYEHATVTVDPSATINPTTGVVVVTGTAACTASTPATLVVTLGQPQKNGRVTGTVQATASVTIACGAAAPWSVAIRASSGAFGNGDGTASAQLTALPPNYLAQAPTSAAVKLYWGHK